MAKAVEAHTTSRRSFLAAAAVAGAIVAPKIAAAESHPDAELIELGKKMDEHYRRLEIAEAKNRPLLKEIERRVEQWKAENPSHKVIEQFEARARIREEMNFAPVDDMIGEIDPIARDIMAIPAATIVGLSVKARLAKAEIADFWKDSDEDATWDALLMRNLCDAVIDMAARNAAAVAAS
jgi:hypothetical protein